MKILELTILPIGRMIIHHDYVVEEVTYVPDVDQDLVEGFQTILRLKASPWASYQDVVMATCYSIFGPEMDTELVIVHSADESELIPEPEVS